MRNEFAKAVLDAAVQDERILFLTGDLGYKALEEVRDTLGHRFINAGIAEQNMVSVAAGLASKGFIPFVYSITPFLILRPFEQIRNDVCFHNLPVIFVGNGGGYGYGIMGSSHHALQDVGLMRMLPNMKIFIPAFSSDVACVVERAIDCNSPAYIRLNSALKSELKFDFWRKIMSGKRGLVLGMGPVTSNAIAEIKNHFVDDFSVWAVGILPIISFPEELISEIAELKKLVILEEHCGPGGLGECIAVELLKLGISNLEIIFLNAVGYPSGRYGSQTWHQAENGLVGEGLSRTLRKILE